jgi:stearoyl-CoA desaturase (delta-9 desaturase)
MRPDEAFWYRVVATGLEVVPVAGLLVAVALWCAGIAPRAADLVVLGIGYTVTGLAVSVGFHRLFAHRSFETNRPARVTFAILGCMAGQGGVTRWVAVHRRHHANTDKAGDPHSPILSGTGIRGALRGLWHSAIGWHVGTRERTSYRHFAPDIVNDPILQVIDRYYFVWLGISLVVPTLLGGLVGLSWRGALLGFLWGGLIRLCLYQHATYSVNSICHFFGSRPFATHDASTNNLIVAILVFGEGWHNNHHAFPSAARNGFAWWQIDVSAYVILLLKALGLARNVKNPSAADIEARKLRLSRRDSR